MGVLRLVVAIARETGEMHPLPPPPGRMRRSSSPSSAMHVSAIEILFGFLILPTSLEIPFWRGNSSLDKEETPGARSTLTTDGGRARGRNSSQKRSKPARRDQLCLLSIKQEEVKELDVSQNPRTSCRWWCARFYFGTSILATHPSLESQMVYP